jgi:hypothetical protein
MNSSSDAAKIEAALRAYFSTYDGTKKDFAVMKPAFETLFHPDCQITLGDKTNNYEEMKTVVAGLLSMATLCDMSTFEFQVTGEKNQVSYKIRVQNDKVDLMGHSVATVKDGMILTAGPAEESLKRDYTVMRQSGDDAHIEPALIAYFSTYDGTKKDFSEIEAAFENLFHPECQVTLGDKTDNYEDMKKAVAGLLSIGTKCDMDTFEFRVTGDKQVHYKIHIKNEKIDLMGHSVATLKDGKILTAGPAEESLKQDYIKMRQSGEQGAQA